MFVQKSVCPGIFFLFLLIISIPGYGQIDFPKTSLALEYQTEYNIPIHYSVMKNDTSYIVFLKIGFPRGTTPDKDFDLSYELKADYTSSSSIMSRTFNYNLHGIGTDNNDYFYRLLIPLEDEIGILLVRLKETETGAEFIQDIPLNTRFNYPPPDFFIKYYTIDLPFCNPYLHKQETIIVDGNPSQGNRKYFVYHYANSFTAADPPMYRLNKNISKSLEIDSTFLIEENKPFNLIRSGLYFIQSDTNSLTGIAFRVEDRYFPKLTRIEDVIAPVIYLSTGREIEKLHNTDDPKMAFDKFWLNLSRSEDIARKHIKSFYDRIETTNILFTNYKEGWKTDMGMIYLIFGTPDEVYNNGETETWYYNKATSSPVFVFNFVRLKSPFTFNHYTLLRDRKYKSIWYKAIDDWRKGRR